MIDTIEQGLRVYKGFTVTRTDPYGLWVISQNDKPVKGLTDSYTMTSMAFRAIDNHLFWKEREELEKKAKKTKDK